MLLVAYSEAKFQNIGYKTKRTLKNLTEAIQVQVLFQPLKSTSLSV